MPVFQILIFGMVFNLKGLDITMSDDKVFHVVQFYSSPSYGCPALPVLTGISK